VHGTDLTAALLAAHDDSGDGRTALDRLVPLVYAELRRMARVQIRCDGRRLTLGTTGLVHEAYLKLIDGARAPVRSRAYFFGAAARAMRQVLVDAARRRNRHKRGGGVEPIPLDQAPPAVDETAYELLELDRALGRLAESHPRPARVLECRFFGGLSVAETAEVVEVTERTVQRDWDFARAWLRRELGCVVEPAEAR
jgi:RNA polymerase sigma factor (TIGR02999 family)